MDTSQSPSAAQSVTMAELRALFTAINNVRTVFLAMCPNTLLGGKDTLMGHPSSYLETNFKSLVQLFVLVSSIHATYIKPVDEILRDDDALAQERLAYARQCAILAKLTTQELEFFAIGAGEKLHKPGVEHICVTAGVRCDLVDLRAFSSVPINAASAICFIERSH
jgi:hypothetical protein